MEPAKVDAGPRAFPWATIALAVAAAVAWASPGASARLIYDRSDIFHFEWWRLWTGHVVHYGNSHVFWNLVVFLPVGGWLERVWPATTRWFYLLCPLFISLLLLAADPTLTRYAGLSGLATGAVVLLAALQLLRHPEEPVWFWLAVLALVAVKIIVELRAGAPLIVSSKEFAGIRNVPLSHLGGVICAALFWLPHQLRALKSRAPAQA